MKINCCVEVCNRSLPYIVRNKKHYAATLAICNKSKKKKNIHNAEDVILVLCTYQNPSKTKYKIYNNLRRLFTQFIYDGKAKVRFEHPPHDIIISDADPLQLKAFLNGVRLTKAGRGRRKIRLSESPTKVELSKQRLSITNRRDSRIKAGFPDSLKWLQVQKCDLITVDQRIFRLQNLQVLDLANNHLKEIPLALGEIHLKELVLQKNDLRSFPPELAVSALGQTLQVLDLSFNKIHYLSPHFCLMKNISVLSLKGNNLQKLPRNIHCLESLRMCDVSYNDLKVLPFGIRKLHRGSLNFYPNPLNADFVLRPITLFPTLKECAGSAILKHNVQYTPEHLPKSLIDHFVEHCPCPCGARVFQNVSSCILAGDVADDIFQRFIVPLEIYFCSTTCSAITSTLSHLIQRS